MGRLEDDVEYDDGGKGEAERRKQERGMAPFGTAEYYRNAAYILSAYTNQNEETRQKMDWLEKNGYYTPDTHDESDESERD
jgi:hypothetical protein